MQTMIISLVTAVLGCIGFALLFDVDRRHIIWAAIGGGLTFLVYMLGKNIGLGTFFVSILASAFATCYAEIMARIKKSPAIIYLILSLIPLIPGSSLYYMMQSMVQGDMDLARSFGRETIAFSLGLAAGMSLIIAFRGVKSASNN